MDALHLPRMKTKALKALIVGNDLRQMDLLERLIRSRYHSTMVTPAKSLNRLVEDHFDVLVVTQTVSTQVAADLIRQASAITADLNIVWLADWQTPVLERHTSGRVVEIDQRLRHFLDAMGMLSQDTN